MFLFLAAGITVTLFGAAISFITSEMAPLFILGFQCNRNWYYFADYDVESNMLALDIRRKDPDAVIIYGVKRDEHRETPDYPCMFLNTSLPQIVARKKNTGTKCKVFLMKENDIGVNSRASNLHNLPVEVYARTTNGQDKLSGNINFFHSYDCCARQYWLSRPLCSHENTIVIIGFGNYGWSILERAILINVISVQQCVRYHIFGDAKQFLALHYRLKEVFSLNEESDTGDSLIFHDGFWGEQPLILEKADRIIICEDDEQKGWNIFWNLNRAAVAINDIFRRSVSYPTRDWDELDDFHRQSKIVAADHLHMKIRVLLEDETITGFSASAAEQAYRKYCETKTIEAVNEAYRRLDYMRWIRFYVFYNWSYGPVRIDGERKHPMLCGYEKLTPAQKKERDAAWELLGQVSSELRAAGDFK